MFMQTIKQYSGPLWFLGFALVIFNFPVLAAILLGGLFLSISVFWGLMVYRFRQFQNTASTQTAQWRDFERNIYESGGPSFRNISVRVFRTDDF
jgi:hypothetical protein